MQARWALRELPAGAWSQTAGFELTTSRLVAGFDPSSSTWLLGTLSSNGHPRVSVIDYDGALLLETASLGNQVVYEIGNPICGHGPGCTMLYSTSEIGGPSLGRIDFVIDSDPTSVYVASSGVFEGQDVYGRAALAPSGLAAFRGVAGWRHFEFGTDDDVSLDPQAPPMFSLRDWPLGLGAYVDQQDALSHRLARPLAVACGNGIIQGSEQCDDGNLEPGDGCDANCRIEPGCDCEGTPPGVSTCDCSGPSTTGMATTGADTTGDSTTDTTDTTGGTTGGTTGTTGG
jgi:cysteine-rich repeat protein